MKTRVLGSTGLEVSEIGLGTSKGLVEKLSREQGETLVKKALDLGVNFIDTARHYGRGEAEARVGAGMAGRRDRVYICSKAGTLAGGGRSFDPDDLEGSVAQSLRKLKTDYLDVLLLHMASGRLLSSSHPAVETLAALREKGIARFIGVSVEDDGLLPALDVPEFEVLEITYNIANLYPEESGFFARNEKRNRGLVIKEPLAAANFLRSAPSPPWAAYMFNRLKYYDFLKDESRMPAAEVALRFVLSSPHIQVAIPATANIRHLADNCRLSDGKGLAPDLVKQVRECYQRARETVG